MNELNELSKNEVKEKFKIWLSEQEHKNGKYSPQSVDGYTTALENACYEMTDLVIQYKNLFEVLDLNEFLKSEAKIRKSKEYKKVNKKYGNGRLSAAMRKYPEFLCELNSKSRVAWFVGANIEDEDKTDEFISKGIWENGYDDKYIDIVKDIKVGDLIAIKTSYTRKNDLPFDNKDNTISVMCIKAIGKVTKNYNDGKKIEVDWDDSNSKEWYFYTSRTTIWKVVENDGWKQKNLIDFSFDDGDQLIDKFMNEYFESENETTENSDFLENGFEWTKLYQNLADGLLKFKNRRTELLVGIDEIYKQIDMKNPLVFKASDGSVQLLDDVCPFTIFGLFNKGIKDENRILLISHISKLLDVDEEIPEDFKGIPVLNNMRSWFFANKDKQGENDIENLWNLFEIAINLSEECTDELKNDFINLYDKVIDQFGVQWNITFGLYWIRPYSFLTLDKNTRNTLENVYKINIPRNSRKKVCMGKEYLKLIELLKNKFENDDYTINSFPGLSYDAWLEDYEVVEDIEILTQIDSEPYSKDDFLNDVFISEEEYETMASLLKRKKNLILQGAPGVGKTYAAKRIAYAMLEKKDDSKIQMLQFHQSYSYEDFIMGYRPNGNGFELKEGPFYKFCVLAAENPDDDYFFIIDEINRGNLSKIFGELLMLIENDKRGDELILTYSDVSFFVPENVHIIGMMNTADRSLAIIDYALRRRFSFFEMEPAINKNEFKSHLIAKGASEELISKIVNRINIINTEIEKDVNLGKGFMVGHSYFCNYDKSENWYSDIIKYEIKPLLEEYWFDDLNKVNNLVDELLR